MKEFMLLIRNEKDHQENWSSDKQQQFLKACESYIEELKKNGHLKIAQPLIREGKLVSGSEGQWKLDAFNERKEVIVGYYHLFAKDMEEAISLAKKNPEFEFSSTARIEVRPIKIKEEATGFTYPEQHGPVK